ncbi:hypothetical protein Dfri01_39090 [Dyadobacter frigoris]|uniref:hypothetical protein n=1 Tax=Dyadobacter frigoris TaxID=2576211 RepID=UPI0024A3CBBC|nr:hypothetical protein [Dyadobacter frigoris]GLU54448.1 hypothetical protein Dfri01_39090 [Dyadobacter frigoris]
MKTVKVKLAYQADKPVNFKFGDINVIVGTAASTIEQQYADKIMAQYPGWIELVVSKAASIRIAASTREA